MNAPTADDGDAMEIQYAEPSQELVCEENLPRSLLQCYDPPSDPESAAIMQRAYHSLQDRLWAVEQLRASDASYIASLQSSLEEGMLVHKQVRSNVLSSKLRSSPLHLKLFNCAALDLFPLPPSFSSSSSIQVCDELEEARGKVQSGEGGILAELPQTVPKCHEAIRALRAQVEENKKTRQGFAAQLRAQAQQYDEIIANFLAGQRKWKV